LNPKWTPKYKNPPIWANFGFQVDYDAANWYLNFTGMLSTMSRCNFEWWSIFVSSFKRIHCTEWI
jgi:hypothetical protein